ncbi:MAG: prepilin-type N-terminal cleavage/methylation domain-containing protein [Gemmataceae bacterium]|nr:prepilin-type N-terminal cleavage/methylation domain-containing protein [Gemmataceae bacterium]
MSKHRRAAFTLVELLVALDTAVRL